MLGVENLVKGFVMPLRTGQKRKDPPEKDSLLRFVRDRLREDPSESNDLSALYKAAMNDLVDFWLTDDGPDSLTAEQVGKAYERLRGFHLDIDPEGEPTLVATALGKRNQGLFYTPKTIVRNIVESTLDALGLCNPADYMTLKVLDPSVGVGTFLAEALDQLTVRALRRQPRHAGCEPVEAATETHGETRCDASSERDIRRHLLENCLYGLDLDATAVRIAQAVLRKRACCDADAAILLSHVRLGNSLMGATWQEPPHSAREVWNRVHGKAYLGKRAPGEREIEQWARDKGVFHWPLEFPEVAAGENAGFHAIIGNPPYEIMSVKESGIEDRQREQRYFRQMYRTCAGKINSYRLMMERCLELLADGGVLGFIVPATLLADSTAAPLRKMILDGFSVCRCVVIPERARAFQGVTQAFAIVVVRKTGGKGSVCPVSWDGTGSMPLAGPVEISRKLIDSLGFRIPVLQSAEDKELLERLSVFPSFKGDGGVAPAGTIHQGEVNLTVHRRCITTEKTPYPLIRGEHVLPFRIEHPTPGRLRLDWILPEFVPQKGPSSGEKVEGVSRDKPSRGRAIRSDAWTKERIVVGRVVNMDTAVRLKAAPVSSGSFLGDMTNSISDLTLPRDYLLGLLNSRLLNWRFKLTSTNSYISAAEIESLPIPRVAKRTMPTSGWGSVEERLVRLTSGSHRSIRQCASACIELFREELRSFGASFTAKVIELVAAQIVAGLAENGQRPDDLLLALDSLVVLLYGVESAANHDMYEA
jgi:Alw26I/Eco31I/Esp3I family type II restriction m6 adenine DNA methyltransferase